MSIHSARKTACANKDGKEILTMKEIKTKVYLNRKKNFASKYVETEILILVSNVIMIPR